MQCPTCGELRSQSGMMCGPCAKQAASVIAQAYEMLNTLELPFANMNRQLEKLIEKLPELDMQLCMYARNQES